VRLATGLLRVTKKLTHKALGSLFSLPSPVSKSTPRNHFKPDTLGTDKPKLNNTVDPNVSILDGKKPLTKKDLCSWFGISTETIDKAVRDGSLRRRKLGPYMVRFDPSDVREWWEGK
jgi:excisionase family DNA binding protein